MKICAIGDMHGLQNNINIEPCNLLLICGDVIPLKMQRNIPQSLSWLKKKFVPWCQKQPCENIILVAGNHDFAFENNTPKIKEIFRGSKVIYLENEVAEYMTEDGRILKIFGTPVCKVFGNWAFMKNQEACYDYYSRMPKDCDIVVSHDAPYGVSDICWGNGIHIGNETLRSVVLEKNPKLLVHGHLHSSNHEIEMLENTKVVNVSVVDESYTISYKPFYYDIQF